MWICSPNNVNIYDGNHCTGSGEFVAYLNPALFNKIPYGVINVNNDGASYTIQGFSNQPDSNEGECILEDYVSIIIDEPCSITSSMFNFSWSSSLYQPPANHELNQGYSVWVCAPNTSGIYDSEHCSGSGEFVDRYEPYLFNSMISNESPPITSSVINPTPNPDGTYPEQVQVSLSATSSAESIANIFYTLDEGSKQTYLSPFNVAGAGNHTITYWPVDSNGIQEVANSRSIVITENYNITGEVFIDANKNGLMDNGDFGYQGATIKLNNGQSAVSGSNGSYSFTNLEQGNYTGTFILPNGFTTTTNSQIQIALSSNSIENFGIYPNPPNIESLYINPNPLAINSQISSKAVFTDPLLNLTDKAVWTWGDSKSDNGNLTEQNGSGSASSSHIYKSLGAFEINLSITDVLGLSGEAQTFAAVIPTNGLKGANLQNTNYSYANLSGQIMDGSVLQNATFIGTNLVNSSMVGISAQKANFTSANFQSANLTSAIFSNANLTLSILQNSTLNNANFNGSNLQHAYLQGAKIANGDFRGTNLKDANFSSANILNPIWSNTICPDGTNSNNDKNTCIGRGGGL